MGEGVECGKSYSDGVFAVAEQPALTEDVIDKGKDILVSSPRFPSSLEVPGTSNPDLMVGVLVNVVASSSTTPLPNALIDDDGFQLVVRKCKHTTLVPQESTVRVSVSAVQSQVPLNTKGISLVVLASPRKGGRNMKCGK
ncbi:unnamed protein product [Linum trigynum]|uniref:Uncharacterized protein n=1 Tax=Linum trigynum TaxID=586398 RepID=A0AAV2E4M9_9ROSI